MENIKLNHYNIIETFKTNDNQSIYIGNMIETETETETVIINAIKNKDIINLLLSHEAKDKFINSLDNLLSFHVEDDSVTLVTKLKDAIPLESYLEENSLSLKGRMDLALDYLKAINKYNQLDLSLMSILVDESQIVMEKGTITFDELLIVENIDITTIDFTRVGRKIGDILHKIIMEYNIISPINYQLDDSDNLITPELIKFIEALRSQQHGFLTLEELMDEFRKHYIYFVCVHNIGNEGSNHTILKKPIPPVLEDKAKIKEKNKFIIKKPSARIIAMCMAVLLIISGTVFGYYYLNKSDKEVQNPIGKEDVLPVAQFEISSSGNQWRFTNNSYTVGNAKLEQYLWEIKKDGRVLQELNTRNITLVFKDPGKYEISLMVRDSEDRWSERFIKDLVITQGVDESQEDASTQSPSGYTISHEGNAVRKNTEIRRNSGFSYELMGDKSSSITLEGFSPKANNLLNFWIMADASDAVEISVKGYLNNKLAYDHTVSHKNQANNSWQMLSFHLGEKLDNIKITFSNHRNTIFIGDIKLELFK